MEQLYMDDLLTDAAVANGFNPHEPYCGGQAFCDNDNEAAWMRFHEANPHVYDMIERFAFEAIAAGHKHYSMMAIIQRVRWHTMVETEGGDTFKINNNFSPYYSRQFAANNPRFSDFFRRRAVQGEMYV